MFKDKRDIITILLILIILVEGFCIYTTNKSVVTVCDEINNKPNIKFEVKSFDLNYSNNDSGGLFTNEEYKGKGIIVPVGDENLLKKDYSILLQITRIKGGLDTDTLKQWVAEIQIHNGIGEFTTDDSKFYRKDKFSKPEYKFQVLGYQEYKSN